MRETYVCPLCGYKVTVENSESECPHCSHVRRIHADGSWTDVGAVRTCAICGTDVPLHTDHGECPTCHSTFSYTEYKWKQQGIERECEKCHTKLTHHSSDFSCPRCKAYICFNTHEKKWEYHGEGSHMLEWLKGNAIIWATCIALVVYDWDLKVFCALLMLGSAGFTMYTPTLRRKCVSFGIAFSLILLLLVLIWLISGWFVALLLTAALLYLGFKFSQRLSTPTSLLK